MAWKKDLARLKQSLDKEEDPPAKAASPPKAQPAAAAPRSMEDEDKVFLAAMGVRSKRPAEAPQRDEPIAALKPPPPAGSGEFTAAMGDLKGVKAFHPAPAPPAPPVPVPAPPAAAPEPAAPPMPAEAAAPGGPAAGADPPGGRDGGGGGWQPGSPGPCPAGRRGAPQGAHPGRLCPGVAHLARDRGIGAGTSPDGPGPPGLPGGRLPYPLCPGSRAHGGGPGLDSLFSCFQSTRKLTRINSVY